MKLLVTGATGYIGSRVVQALQRHGHEVVGLVRTLDAADRLRSAGVQATLGDLAQPSSFRTAAMASDGVIHTAFGHDIDFTAAVEQERRAVASLIDAYAGTGKRLVISTATGVVGDTGPEPVDESFPGQPDFPARARMAVEEDLLAAASLDIRSVVIRPAVLVHGHGAGQFVPMLARTARDSGRAAYIGHGQNRIATVHVDDLADLYPLAAEKAPAGSLYNGAGDDVAMRDVASAIAQGQPNTQVRSISADEAGSLWGAFPAMLLALNNRTSGNTAREQLGWQPYAARPSLVDDLARGSYARSGATAAA